MSPSFSRRGFLQGTASAAALTLAGRLTTAEAADAVGPPSRGKKIIAIQLDATGPADEGAERVLDSVQQHAGVNVLLVDSLWFSPEVTSAALAKASMRGHVQDPNSKLLGGRMGFVRPQYYKDTGLDLRSLAPAAGVPDILAALCDGAKRRGMRVMALFKDDPPRMAGSEALCEQDFNGARATTSCKANPHYRNLVRGAMEDLVRSYDIAGIMYMAERQGPFTDTLGLRFRGQRRGLPGTRTCFCSHCQASAKAAGISFERARRGFEELARFTAAGRERKRPVDGYYVTLWRLMLRYPELLAWEHLWYENTRELYRIVRQSIKAARPDALHGMHVWPNINMSPIIRAEHDFAELGQYHDFIKVAMYHNCGGPRFGTYIDSVSETMYGDLPPEEVLEFHYRVMNYREVPLARLRQTGLKNDFVYRESQRIMDAARGTNAMMLPGIDVDIPLLAGDMGPADPKAAPQTTRAGVREAVTQAFKAGVPGIVLSREYCDMKFEHLAGVRDAVRELKLEI